MQGYQVTGTDISSKAVERARAEAERLGVRVVLETVDVRKLADQVEGRFDVVLSCDNSLPHLLTDEDLQNAARGLWEKVKLGGLLLVGIRDYDQLMREKPSGTVPRMFVDSQGRRVVFQVWEWGSNGHTYTLHLFLLREQSDGWQTEHYETEYRALLRGELSALLEAAGFMDVRWHMPDETGHHQPLVTARKPEGHETA
jgi:SAM-dependent methyltransferase